MNIVDHIKPVNVGNSSFVAANEDLFNGSPATDVINMQDWRDCLFLLQKGAGAVGTATITVESCDDVTPTTATAVAFKYRTNLTSDTWGSWTEVAAAGFATTAGADQMYEIWISADGLSGTDKYVRMQCTEVDSTAVDGSISALLVNPRYSQDQLGRTVLT